MKAIQAILVRFIVPLALLAPLYLGTAPPQWDYFAHLSEAQIVADWDDPTRGVQEGYEIRPGWFLRSNALSTLILACLPLSLEVSGRLLNSLIVLLMYGGLLALLHRQGSTWPLALTTPVVVYAFPFTGGFLNFSLAMGLGLVALAFYLRWVGDGRRGWLIGIGLLLLLASIAHLLAWGLFVSVIASLAIVHFLAPADRPGRRPSLTALGFALMSGIPLTLFARPLLGLLALVSVPALWGAALIFLRLRPRLQQGLLGLAALLGLIWLALRPLEKLLANVRLSYQDKLWWPLKVFSLPYPFSPPLPWLAYFNLLLLGLFALLAGLLLAAAWQERKRFERAWLAPVALIAALYVLLPSDTGDITQIEPRLVLMMSMILLAAAVIPARKRWQQVLTAVSVAVFAVHTTGLIAYTRAYSQQAQRWTEQMEAALPPGRRLLVLHRTSQQVDRSRVPAWAAPWANFYSGSLYSTRYNIQRGGVNNLVFLNGPLQTRSGRQQPDTSLPYLDLVSFVETTCPILHAQYDAALYWGRPDPPLQAALDACFGPGRFLPDLSVWKIP